MGGPARNPALPPLRAEPEAHVTLETGPIVWCSTCGAYAESRAQLLTRACQGQGDRRDVSLLSRRRAIIALTAGIHPMTAEVLEPVKRQRLLSKQCVAWPGPTGRTAAQEVARKRAGLALLPKRKRGRYATARAALAGGGVAPPHPHHPPITRNGHD